MYSTNQIIDNSILRYFSLAVQTAYALIALLLKPATMGNSLYHTVRAKGLP
jgi:hypothetical protein